MSPEMDASLLQDFLTEAGELVEQLDADLVKLESTAGEQEAGELLNSIFRALHTVKGAASFLALDEVIRFAHAAEDALNRLRKGEAAVTPLVVDALLQSTDVLRGMVEALGAGEPAPPCPPPLLASLRAIAETAPEVAHGESETDKPTEPSMGVGDEALALPASKQELVGFMAADLREAAQRLSQIIQHAKQPSRRDGMGAELCELTEEMNRTAEFFELTLLSSLVQVVGHAAEKLETISEQCMDSLLVRLAAVASLIERAAAALEEGRVTSWPVDTLLERIQELAAGQRLSPELEGASAGGIDEVLVVDGVVPREDAASPDPAEVRQKASAPMDDRREGERRQDDRRTAAEQTIRVEVDRLEALLNLVGQMVLTKNRVLGISRRLQEHGLPQELTDEIIGAANDLDRLTGTLQVGVTRTRMQPLAKLFDRYPRVIRDVARLTNKQIQLEISGKETEVDKSVLEMLADPLVHILRNSADHGIEAPAARQKCGKIETGTIHLSAEHQGSHVRVAIHDDGKGIDREIIGCKAVEKGLTTLDQLASMSDQDVFQFIFAAGFSTAEQVSDLSGRGVGMDVVRTNIQKMNGTIQIDSSPGEGTAIEILIPLTVAIMPAMAVGVGDQSYCVPLQSIIEIVRPESMHSVNGSPTMRLRDEVLPLIDLRRRLDSETGQPARFALIVGAGSQRAGLLLDRLIGQQDIVIKPLDDTFAQGGPFSGATIQENGEVSLILDVVQLIRQTDTPPHWPTGGLNP